MDSGISEFVRLTWPSVRTTQCRTLVQAADNGDERQRWRQKMERENGRGRWEGDEGEIGGRCFVHMHTFRYQSKKNKQPRGELSSNQALTVQSRDARLSKKVMNSHCKQACEKWGEGSREIELRHGGPYQ